MRRRIEAVMKKEFLHLIRDPRSLIIIIFLPVILLFLYGYSVSLDIKNLPLAILDNSRSIQSRHLIERFLQSGYFNYRAELKSEKQFRHALDSGEVKVVINIPNDFARKVIDRSTPSIQVIVDGSDPTNAASALSYINGIVQQYFSGAQVISSERGANPVNLVSRIWYNENLRSLNFYIPGLISSILMMLSAALTSLTIVSEKEKGTMEALVASPIKKNELMLGKILPYILIAFWDVILVTAVGYFWFHVPIKGSYALLLLCSCIFLAGALSIGLVFSTISKSSQEAMQLAILTTMLPSIMLSGMIFPIENMPRVIQAVTYLVPARYFISIMRGIYLKGVGFTYLLGDLIPLTVFTIALMMISVRTFRKRIE